MDFSKDKAPDLTADQHRDALQVQEDLERFEREEDAHRLAGRVTVSHELADEFPRPDSVHTFTEAEWRDEQARLDNLERLEADEGPY